MSLLARTRRLLSSPPSKCGGRRRRPTSHWSHPKAALSNVAPPAADDDEPIHDVIVLGGGPTGLFLSALLGSHGVRSHLLFDKRPEAELIRHPQAHFVNVRSMEILRAEAPDVYERVRNETPDVGEWEGFTFGGSVLEEDEGGRNGRSVSGGRRLGRVVHPVRAPLGVGQRGDAVLMPKTNETNRVGGAGCAGATDKIDHFQAASPCRPAHLAQNKFVSLLLREARRHCEDDPDAERDDGNEAIDHRHLRYGEEVVEISQHRSASSHSKRHGDDQSPTIAIRTSLGKSYRARYLLAADGAHSFARRHFDIPMAGEPSMQSLINVHFRTNGSLSELLMRRDRSPPRGDRDRHDRAMLHFVYNSRLVGAFVCHDGNEGEWVLQIPFFPPFQTVDDFDPRKVRDMIWAGLLGSVDPRDRESAGGRFDFEILSIRPWTMSSLVARQYLSDSKNVVLVGDAAHSFPPAGGFGMNTGLQDAHNIAWRIALLLNREKKNGSAYNDHVVESSSSAPPPISFSGAILSKYDQERRPIANQNAALSVRNYRRTLQIAKACYLDAEHPRLLVSMLDSPPMNLLPMETRRDMFRRLVDAAMMPLGTLVFSSRRHEGAAREAGHSLHADHIENNVRSILESGGSLPLVFPRYELGFSYDPNDAWESTIANNDESGDTAGYFPRLRVGHRMPHVVVEVLALSDGKDHEGRPVLESLDHCRMAGSIDAADATSGNAICISLTDISSQLRRAHSYSSPVFTLLAFGPELTRSVSLAGEAVNCMMRKWNVPLMLVYILPTRSNFEEHRIKAKSTHARVGRDSKLNNALFTVDTQQSLLQLLRDEPTLVPYMRNQMQQQQNGRSASKNVDDAVNALIMVRPDGHIANISLIDDEKEGVKNTIVQIRCVIEQGFRNALGDVVRGGGLAAPPPQR